MRQPPFLIIATAVILVALAACGRPPDLTTMWTPAPECVILPGSDDGPDLIRIGLVDPVDPENIPKAGNPGEKLLYAHLYETLIAVDCRGEVYPVLAESWTSMDRGRSWTFVLREDAKFWDGTRVTAGDIEESWQNNLTEKTFSAAGLDSTSAEDDRILHVYLDHRHRKVPGVLALPEFAVTKQSPGSDWPLGSGPYRIDKWESDRSIDTITILPASGADHPVIEFLASATSDTRDLINGVVDMMITSDPAVMEYARSRPRLRTIALEWDRTYLLLSTSRVQELRLGKSIVRLSDEIADRIAQYAIRGEARGYRPKSWWNRLRNCGVLSGDEQEIPPLPMGSYAISGFRRILYDSEDPISRGLAERIVALAATDPSTSPEAEALSDAVPMLVGSAHRTIAEGVTPDDITSSLRDGDDFAYVISVPRRSTAPCFEYRKLIHDARWLEGDWIDLSKALIPLVDTRRHVIVRDDRIALSVDWNGIVRIGGTEISPER
jgi:hypothetical protein